MDERLAELTFTIDDVTALRLERETAAGFTRVTTEVHLESGNTAGRGEDVTYETADHEPFPTTGLDVVGSHTISSFSEKLDEQTLHPEPPQRETSRHYRRWAFESAALDLALRQAGQSLGDVLDRRVDPVRFVVSPSLRNDNPDVGPVEELLEAHPGTELKLDPTPDWNDGLIEALVDTGAVRVLDFKGFYEGTDVDNPPDPVLYDRILTAFPDAVVEDARVTSDTRSLLEEHATRLSWDYPITGIDSIESLPFEPQWLNIKPSRFGTVASLFEVLEYCEREEIRLYGGGQFELGVGRGQIQTLAALFYPDGPNDVAPGGYNDPVPAPDLTESPLELSPGIGFGRH
ncbi:MAG: hypothetical protein ABEH64_00605 [Salinirussus sp.]